MYLTEFVDYKNVISLVNKEMRGVTNNIPIVQLGTINKQPAYPFATYSVLNPYLNVKNYTSQDTLRQSIEFTVSYTFYSKDPFEVIELLQRNMSNLTQRGTKQQLFFNGITLVDFNGIGARDNFISIENERRAGFDVRIRVEITSFKAQELIDEVTIPPFEE